MNGWGISDDKVQKVYLNKANPRVLLTGLGWSGHLDNGQLQHCPVGTRVTSRTDDVIVKRCTMHSCSLGNSIAKLGVFLGCHPVHTDCYSDHLNIVLFTKAVTSIELSYG